MVGHVHEGVVLHAYIRGEVVDGHGLTTGVQQSSLDTRSVCVGDSKVKATDRRTKHNARPALGAALSAGTAGRGRCC